MAPICGVASRRLETPGGEPHAKRFHAARAAPAAGLGPAGRWWPPYGPRSPAREGGRSVRATPRRRATRGSSPSRPGRSTQLGPGRVSAAEPVVPRFMAWHTVVIAVLALALACDLYLRGRALLKDRGRARTGMLTWHENRRAFYALAGREFERARRYDRPFTLGYFDVDDYKEVAERFSPLTAEGMLRLVAESARRSIRASDVVARLGGDSFAVLLPEAPPEAADTVIRKLRQSVRDASDETALPLSITGGVVTCLPPAESLQAIIWCEVIAPQPLEAFEPARLRRPFRLPPGFDMPMPPPLRRL